MRDQLLQFHNRMKKRIFGSKQGIGLIEAIVAVAIIGVGMMAVLIAMAPYARVQNLSQLQQKATRYSSEGLEFFRKERDRLGWAEFYSKLSTTTYCLPSTASSIVVTALANGTCTASNASVTGDTVFLRTAVTTKSTDASGMDQVLVKVKTQWTDTNNLTQFSEQSVILKEWK